MTKKEKKGTGAMKMDALRRFCGISRRTRIRNEVIKWKTKINEIVEEKNTEKTFAYLVWTPEEIRRDE